MDVERTIKIILKSQAKTETRLTGITKLMQQGMKVLVKVETNLAESQATSPLAIFRDAPRFAHPIPLPW